MATFEGFTNPEIYATGAAAGQPREVNMTVTGPAFPTAHSAVHLDVRTVIILLLAGALLVSCALNWFFYQDRNWLHQSISAQDDKMTQLIKSEREMILTLAGQNTRELGNVAAKATNAIGLRTIEMGSDTLIPLKEMPDEPTTLRTDSITKQSTASSSKELKAE